MIEADIKRYKKILKSRLDEKRYYHSLCVADEAKRLSGIYGADREKMYIAGLLHDVTKNCSNTEQLQILENSAIILSADEKASPPIWHAITGAEFVKNELKIEDKEIVTAIRYHTTGKADMTLEQKILFVADLTSKDRTYSDIDEIRKKADASLDEAMLDILKFTITNLVSKGKPVHSSTLDAYNWLVIKGDKNGIV